MSNANDLELGMLGLINDEREAAGLEPLRLITALNDAAEAHSSWMLDTDMFSHAGLNGSSPSDRMEAAGYPFEGASMALENIGWQSARGAEGFEDDVAQVHASLMNSPGHRANILNADAEDIGIGIETGTFTGQSGDYDAVMVTQVFGSTDADISAWVDPGTGEVEDDVVAEDDSVVEDGPVMEEAPVEEDDPVDEDDPVEDEETDDGMADDDELAEDDDVDEEEDPVDDETPEDDAEEDPAEEDEDDDADDPDVVAEDDSDPVADVPGDDMSDEDTPGEGDTPDDDMGDIPACGDVPDMPGVPMPFELSEFTVDLRSAFEFTREGDQLIWETSEERLFEVFMEAFEDWAGMPVEAEDAQDADGSADIVDLMLDETPQQTMDAGASGEEMDDWLLESCL